MPLETKRVRQHRANPGQVEPRGSFDPFRLDRYSAGMRIGIFTAPSTIDSFVEGCQTAKAQGYVDVWAPQIFGLDTMQVIGIAAREVPGLSFGTSVVPTYPRHPMSMAQMALTTAEATGGRFTLGIGLSHKVVIEGMYGMSFDKPANHMREYKSVARRSRSERKRRTPYRSRTAQHC
jgi:alkanesulfonate monooxygenase SsuD/methylene tetrahydromethanopterin reductase-like flavin-dependent oxidoreductase (luciferase family)